ncbi:MAG: hypothetical protein R2731_06300 [Nocardioides sp.]
MPSSPDAAVLIAPGALRGRAGGGPLRSLGYVVHVVDQVEEVRIGGLVTRGLGIVDRVTGLVLDLSWLSVSPESSLESSLESSARWVGMRPATASSSAGTSRLSSDWSADRSSGWSSGSPGWSSGSSASRAAGVWPPALRSTATTPSTSVPVVAAHCRPRSSSSRVSAPIATVGIQ